jgi:Rrf2 family iron-sulfur cluster assembly transcriptional regulator
MQISMAGKYAIRAMMHLASISNGTIIQISELSEKWEIPDKYLRKIIPQLAKAGLIYSRRGMGGGVILARPSKNISFLEVVEAVEGKIFLSKCLMSPDMCEKSPWCSANRVWHEAQESMKKVLASKNLEELAISNEIRFSEQQEKCNDNT